MFNAWCDCSLRMYYKLCRVIGTETIPVEQGCPVLMLEGHYPTEVNSNPKVDCSLARVSSREKRVISREPRFCVQHRETMWTSKLYLFWLKLCIRVNTRDVVLHSPLCIRVRHSLPGSYIRLSLHLRHTLDRLVVNGPSWETGSCTFQFIKF